MCYLIAISHLTATFLAFVKLHFFHLKNISKLSLCSQCQNVEMLIHAFMTSRLDYSNALLGGCSARLINKLQMSKMQQLEFFLEPGSMTTFSPVMSTLHWLAIKHRIDLKILLITY